MESNMNISCLSQWMMKETMSGWYHMTGGLCWIRCLGQDISFLWWWVQSLNFAPNPSPSVPETQSALADHSFSSGIYNYKPQHSHTRPRVYSSYIEVHVITLDLALTVSWSGFELKIDKKKCWSNRDYSAGGIHFQNWNLIRHFSF